jgi:nucleoside-diphosphate-sugar epimerase
VKALVTGSSGFIGSHLTEALLKRGYEVFCLIREKSDLKWTKNLDVTFIKGDYLNKDSLRDCVKGMDYVFHLGAVLEAENWETYYKTNVLGTRNLVQACAEINPEIKKFIYVSSISASGPFSNNMTRDETCACHPSSLYGKSKLYAEKIVYEFKDKIPVTIARPPNVIGKRQKEVFFLMKLLKKRLFPVLGGESKQTSICFVEDLVQALILMAEKEKARSQTYYVTDNKAYSWKEMMKITAEKMGVYPYVIKIPFPLLASAAQFLEIISKITGKKPMITTRYLFSAKNDFHLYSSQKIQNELGFKHKTEFTKGMETIIEWHKKQNLL